MMGYGAIASGLLLLLIAIYLFRGAYAAGRAASTEVAEFEANFDSDQTRKRGRSDFVQIDLHPRKLEEGEEFGLPTRLTSNDPLLRPLNAA